MIGSDVSQSTSLGNGVTTVFGTGFPFLANAHVTVEKRVSGGTVFNTLTEGVDYALTGAAVIDNDGNRSNGDVTMTVAPANGDTIRITRNTPLLQLTHLRQQGSFLPGVHEEVFDRACMELQDLERRVAALEAGGAPVTVSAAKVTDTFVVSEPVENSFPRVVACSGTPTMVLLARIEDLTDGTVIPWALGEPGWSAPALGQFTITDVPGLMPGHNTRLTYLVFSA